MCEVNARWSFAKGDIQKQHVRIEGIYFTPCLSHVSSRAHGEPMSGQHVCKQRCHERLVFNDEDTSVI
jgi:hypothetical protein